MFDKAGETFTCGCLSRLLLPREAYPQLKANESFLKLQDSLEDAENRISVDRYNS